MCRGDKRCTTSRQEQFQSISSFTCAPVQARRHRIQAPAAHRVRAIGGTARPARHEAAGGDAVGGRHRRPKRVTSTAPRPTMPTRKGTIQPTHGTSAPIPLITRVSTKVPTTAETGTPNPGSTGAPLAGLQAQGDDAEPPGASSKKPASMAKGMPQMVITSRTSTTGATSTVRQPSPPASAGLATAPSSAARSALRGMNSATSNARTAQMNERPSHHRHAQEWIEAKSRRQWRTGGAAEAEHRRQHSPWQVPRATTAPGTSREGLSERC